jgi:predicted nucleic acid-binding Zn finger protein
MTTNTIKHEVIYVGHNVSQWLVKDYIISENKGDWQCSCAIKYKRNPKLKCKHISIVQTFLLSDEEREILIARKQKREIMDKLKNLTRKVCKTHKFESELIKGEYIFTCKQCKSTLNLEEFKFYRRHYNLN